MGGVLPGQPIGGLFVDVHSIAAFGRGRPIGLMLKMAMLIFAVLYD